MLEMCNALSVSWIVTSVLTRQKNGILVQVKIPVCQSYFRFVMLQGLNIVLAIDIT